MGQESFEDLIKKKFEHTSMRSPTSVWEGLEGVLNTELIATYQSKQSIYKSVAVAAMLIAMTSLAFQFFPRSNSDIELTGRNTSAYNALLENSFNRPQSPIRFTLPVFFPAVNTTTKQTNGDEEDILIAGSSDEFTFSSTEMVVARKSSLQLAQLEMAIYPYHQGGYVRQYQQKAQDKVKMWAGVEAGAGNFNASIGQSDVLSSNISQSGLASAIGSDGFVNPETDLNSNLDQGIATSLGLDFGLKLGRKWSIESGIAYTNVDSRGEATVNVLDIYSVENTEIRSSSVGEVEPISPSSREATIEVQDSYDYEIDIRSNVRFTSVPLKAGYFIVDRKMSLRLNAGFAANYLVGSQIEDNTGSIVNGSTDQLYNAWSLDGLGGLEFGYSIFNQFDFTIEPNYRRSITPLNISSNPTSSQFVIQTGLRYTIQ